MKRRNANYALLEDVTNWTAAKGFDPTGTCGNIQRDIENVWGAADYMAAYKKSLAAVGAPMTLARLCALFPGLELDVGGQDYYKITWQTALVHKPTGHVLTFYDYKGGISYGSHVYGKTAPKEFISDARKLFEVLKSKRCPHPYDGCVVGEEA